MKLFIAGFLILSATTSFAGKSSLYWAPSDERCVIYDYRPLIQGGVKVENFFAVEAMNHNGGSMLGEYSVKKNKDAKQAFQNLMKDMVGFAEQCDSVETFIPTASNPEAPI